MLPVNPEAIGLFGLFATVICFGLEQVGVGVKGADHAKLTRSLGYIAVFFGGFTQLFTGVCMYLFSVGGDHSIYLGTVFSFFGLFWILVGFFFLKGGDKKVMAHFFLTALILVIGFTIRAFQDGLIWPGPGGDRPAADHPHPRLVHREACPDQAGRRVQPGHRHHLPVPAFPCSVCVRQTGASFVPIYPMKTESRSTVPAEALRLRWFISCNILYFSCKQRILYMPARRS